MLARTCLAYALLGAAAAATTACSSSFDRYSKVKDLRVLAISAEPPTLLLDAALALPAEVTFTALVLDPRGGDVAFRWTLCPVESALACADYDALRAEAVGTGVHAALDAAHATTAEGVASAIGAAPNGPVDETLRPLSVARFAVPTSALLGLDGYYRDNGFYGYGAGAWPSVILTLDKPGEPPLVAIKRFVVGVADLAAFNSALANFGYHFCQGPADSNCVAWDPDIAGNHNPEFAPRLELGRGSSPLTPFAPICQGSEDAVASGCEPAHVKAGEKVRIRPSFTAASSEPYQIVHTDLQTRTISTEAAVEQISVSWFASTGEMKEDLTWPKFTSTLDTVYTAPSEPPATSGSVAVLWLVARDQRGGETWTSQELTIDPAD